ncbi:hypothetical protein SDC9_184489 [bioreactor metagenome]|uniref:Uncharacterized protein n=1 Tax=bioreactor metagenome TaxID=1076179 RepID=A0A645HD72_9ZZZZ
MLFAVVCDLSVQIFFQFSGFAQFVIEFVLFVFDAFLGFLHFLFSLLNIGIVLRLEFQEFFLGLQMFFLLHGFCLHRGFFYKVFGVFLGIINDEFCL